MNLLNLFSLPIEMAEQFNLLPLVTAIRIMIFITDIMYKEGEGGLGRGTRGRGAWGRGVWGH